MGYTTRDRMINRFSEKIIRELTDDAGIGAIDDTVLQDIIEAASGEVDMILQAAGWTLPLSEVPEWVQTATEIIALRFLYERRQVVPDNIEREYRETVRRLERIARQDLPVREEADLTIEMDGTRDDIIFRR